MSRKTDEIKKSITRLEEIHSKIYKIFNDENVNSLDLVQQEMKSELTNLKLWIDMLYKYNGTSKSHAKVNASRENGKKGGRPPKAVTELKKKKAELEGLLDAIHSQSVTAAFDEEENLRNQAALYEKQLEEIEAKLFELKSK